MLSLLMDLNDNKEENLELIDNHQFIFDEIIKV